MSSEWEFFRALDVVQKHLMQRGDVAKSELVICYKEGQETRIKIINNEGERSDD